MVKTLENDVSSMRARARAAGRVYVFKSPPGAYDGDQSSRHATRLQSVDEKLAVLNDKQREMLAVLLAALRRDDPRGLAYAVDITRAELAAFMGKPELIPLDRERLAAAAAVELVEIEKCIKLSGGHEWVYRIPSGWIVPLVERCAPEALSWLQEWYEARQAEIEAEAAAEAEAEAEAERQAEIEAQAEAAAEAERKRQAKIEKEFAKELERVKREQALAAMTPAQRLAYERRGRSYVAGRYVYVWDRRDHKHVRRARRWRGATAFQWVMLVALALPTGFMVALALTVLFR